MPGIFQQISRGTGALKVSIGTGSPVSPTYFAGLALDDDGLLYCIEYSAITTEEIYHHNGLAFADSRLVVNTALPAAGPRGATKDGIVTDDNGAVMLGLETTHDAGGVHYANTSFIVFESATTAGYRGRTPVPVGIVTTGLWTVTDGVIKRNGEDFQPYAACEVPMDERGGSTHPVAGNDYLYQWRNADVSGDGTTATAAGAAGNAGLQVDGWENFGPQTAASNVDLWFINWVGTSGGEITIDNLLILEGQAVVEAASFRNLDEATFRNDDLVEYR